MSTTALKVVIDTNILITIIGRKSPNRWIFDRIIRGDIELCVSSEILLEYEEVLTAKTHLGIARNVIDFLLISPYVHLTDIFFHWNLIDKDPDDNKFIDCTLASGADYLVSNDQHFTVMKTVDFPKISVLSLEEFTSDYFANTMK